MKLHLGCGDKYIEGFVNIDNRLGIKVDIVDDVRYLESIEDDSIDLIYASHILEHFTRFEYMEVLDKWHKKLRSEGTLRISVPDFNQIVKRYRKFGLAPVSGLLYGGQTYEGNFHNWAWDFESLREDLKDIGFKDIRRYDWRETEHANIDDFSQAYLPHMDKENGMLMSLNVEATR